MRTETVSKSAIARRFGLYWYEIDRLIADGELPPPLPRNRYLTDRWSWPEVRDALRRQGYKPVDRRHAA
jgi:hypothetical protein